MSIWSTIEQDIQKHTGTAFNDCRQQSISGGCINSAYEVSAQGQRYFVKLNDAEKVDMFAAEAAGLNEMLQSNSVRVPKPICWGRASSSAYIVMEYVPLRAGGSKTASILGKQMANMHQATANEFGWNIDNTIGSTPQINTPHKDWIEFLRTNRFEYQLQLAAGSGYGRGLQQKGERLLADLDLFFRDYSPVPSLLHGDLWSGNVSADDKGQPVIYDPAVYYGDREADLAMTELFGGFPRDFYAAYDEAYAIDPGYSLRKTLYNLYHILNHLNLFGGGYGAQAEHMMDSLLSQIK